MAEIKVPELAESITEGTVAQWLKQPGDTVTKGDYVVELETDKVNVEIISEHSGVLQEIKAQEGDTVNVGETIAVVNESGQAAPAPEKAEEKPEAPKAEEPKAEGAYQQSQPLKKNRWTASNRLTCGTQVGKRKGH